MKVGGTDSHRPEGRENEIPTQTQPVGAVMQIPGDVGCMFSRTTRLKAEKGTWLGAAWVLKSQRSQRSRRCSRTSSCHHDHHTTVRWICPFGEKTDLTKTGGWLAER